MSKITLLIHCPDTSGIIAHVTSFFYKRQGNIIYIDQYVDVENTVFFMRLECEFNSQTSIKITKDEFRETVAKQYKMSWQMYSASAKPRMAVFVSKYDHCLYDILSRYKSNELEVDIPLIISNHIDLEHVAQSFGIPFYHIPVTARNREKAAESQLALLQKEKVDFIVLARYMQIIPKSLIAAFPNRIINIHHSFLPAFAGAKPYHLAYKRGVKIIGATSHYVTEELDAGPIIEQDITRISHSHSIKDLILKGRDLEKIVLAKGIKYHIERKTLVFNNKTIVFI
ncbi:formyltetrahydrofolate deformylase [Salegentibacter mishustinae]|uniref:Formyltetrahydrofolate deformylase n=1 Tax=Salegentibacter mishustinae TaxID=270918 RepID=A0A0Q9ZBQ7_9FLAO|nr:formyltetrahydrofolate deformylase [Salegentibacter mishustinae]KRG30480.1 formyltetrahydrofolate deformylase [Salegentibacter mishustinae]PNW23372.1 formyltetrahydrofolate deformylase [Salegentibacter mishustinae]PZX66440.1 formyltetrahydrofolate deformylase [Salegentibacter mishustinae]GGW82544.1 formyltetrahydrofolate deformylase [Salegentibacter mishustinae]